MVEVFKTDVTNSEDAKLLTAHIEKTFNGYTANFDLDDCDLILRVQYLEGAIKADQVIYLLEEFGFKAEILVDDFRPNVAPYFVG